jgi:cell division protein ZipA
MTAELRWILLGLSLVLLAGIWWWGARRSAQAPGNAELREIKPSPEPPRHELPAEDIEREPAHAPQVREWVSPLEPLSIRTGEYERVPVLDGPMMVNADPARTPAAGVAATGPLTATGPVTAIVAAPGTGSAGATEVSPARAPALLPESGDRSAPAPAQVPNSSEQQKIVTVRVCAAGDTLWSGAALLSALELHGLAYGRYQVFHRRHVDGRSLFCVASLIEPGTFDVARMAAEEFRGVTLFAVLPGPVEPLLTIDELFAAARGLAQELSGIVQDAKGIPLSPQRAAAMRDDVARFQAALS